MRIALVILLALLPVVVISECTGEFEQCATGECSLSTTFCGKCVGAGRYICPDGITCIANADAYTTCPGLRNTHLDWTLPVEARLDYLVKQATLAEKVGQLTHDAPAIARLGIPSYNWLNDDEHGVMQPHSTDFPNGNSLGATWSKIRLNEVGLAVGTEARGLHNGFVHSGNRGAGQNGAGITMYAPNMNTVRDPRWGRAQEVYSEDPHLSARLTVAFVKGGQGNGADKDYLLAGACCKHYVAYDLESLPKERYYFSATVNARNMWESYMPVFKACIKEAQAMHAMCSYNAVNGVPTCAEPKLMNGILRDQWKWDGFVVSDYDAWAQIADTHKYCADYECAAAAGINAGMDQEGGGTVAIKKLPDALAHGRVTNATIDNAFRRLFRARIKLGMMDPPLLNRWNIIKNDTSAVLSPAHIELARQSAREGMCLYKNDRATLPISASVTKQGGIALIGPWAPIGDHLLGNYARSPDYGSVSVLEGIATAVNQAAAVGCTYEQNIDFYQPGEIGIPTRDAQSCGVLCSTRATCKFFTWYAGGCYLKTSDTGRVQSAGRVSGRCAKAGPLAWEPGCVDATCAATTGFNSAISAAANADVTIYMMALDQALESEGHDRSDIALPANQYKLLKQIRAATKGKPVIVIIVHGGTIALADVMTTDADAVLDAWYPGMLGGHAIADIIFGKYSPAGRSPVTYYQDNVELPAPGTMDFYPTSNGSSKGLTYRFYTGTPTIPFGFGLSYTTFSYSNLRVNATSIDGCAIVEVKVDVTNTGSRISDEVVQVYVKQPRATIAAPSVRLAAFERVYQLAAATTQTITLHVHPEYHSVVLDSADIYTPQQIVEANTFNIYVGGGQPDYYPGRLSVPITVTTRRDIATC